MPLSEVNCDCAGVGACGCPRRFKVTIAGVVPCGPYPCPRCSDMDGSYILDWIPGHGPYNCYYKLPDYDPGPCWYTNPWKLEIIRNPHYPPDCTLRFEVTYGDATSQPWFLDGQCTCWPDKPLTLTGGPGCALGGPGEDTYCLYPATITLEAIGIGSISGNNCYGTKTSCAPSRRPRVPAATPSECNQFPDCCSNCGESIVASTT